MSIDNSLKQLPTDPWGVIMLCHGSRRGASRDECSCSWAAQNGAWPKVVPPMPQHAGVGLTEASQRLQSALGDSKVDVLLSCLEFIEPHPDKAVEVLAGRGRSEVVFMPYLLGHGKHATEELEEVLDGAKRQTPQVKLKLTSGFGADSRLSDLVVDRVRDPDGTPGLAPLRGHPVGVLVVKAGTKTQYDDCNWLRDLGRMVGEQLGAEYAVDVAQSHYGDPTMEFATANLVEGRGVSALVCVPYVFFPGMILKRNVLDGMKEAQSKYPRTPMHVTPSLGVDDGVAAVAAERVREVWNRLATIVATARHSGMIETDPSRRIPS